MAKVLDELRISPARNGGHTVRHTFKPQPINRKGAMSGGMGMDYPESEEHVFGANQGDKLQAHIAGALGLKRGGGNSGAAC